MQYSVRQGAVLFFCLYFCVQVSFTRALSDNYCPLGCVCDLPKKLTCSNIKWSEIGTKELNLVSSLSPIQHLDLSQNKITRLDAFFLNGTWLKKLDLSDNKIQKISEQAFLGLPGLTLLDLSGNHLHTVSRPTFATLKYLERLKLRSNQLVSLQEFTFADLKSLQKLEISDNPWHCDCNLAKFWNWAQSSGIKLTGQAKCKTPPSLADTPVKRMELHCSEFPGLNLIPSHDQVVFAGDSLSLLCRGRSELDRVEWSWGDADPRAKFKAVATETSVGDSGVAESLVRIEKLEPEHSGLWICREVIGGNNTASVSVLVLSDSTQYCMSKKTRGNKGEYFWPQTVAGREIEIPCNHDQSEEPSYATYSCSYQGTWENLNTSQCGYTSETTRQLETLAKETLSEPKEISLEKAKHLLNLTTQSEALNDFMNLVFISKIVEKYSQDLQGNKFVGLSTTLVGVLANLMRAPSALLAEGERQGKACSRLRLAIEHLAGDSMVFQSYKSVLAVEEFQVTPDSFRGLTCDWRQLTGRRQFLCTTQGRPMVDTAGRDLVAVMDLPGSLFLGLDPGMRQLIVSVFSNGHFFPDLVRNDTDFRTSTVVGVNVVGLGSLNLTEPVMVTVSSTSSLIGEPVWWDSQLDNGKGGWAEGVCFPFRTTTYHVIFHCHRLGYYTLRQDVFPAFKYHHSSLIGHAVLYSGSFVLLVCLSVSIVTHILCHRKIQMSRRTKHSIANTWISIVLLCFTFSFGIFSTEDVKICEVVGLALHYFSLSTLLWMVVASNHMYKRLSRGSVERQADDLPPGVPLHKPILGLYLVGWGVGLIVCGISGAVHMRDYAQPEFCFLGAGPALSALLIPAAILVTLVSIFFFLSLCAIRNNDVGQLSEGTTQGTEHMDLELLDEGTPADRMDRRSARSDATDSDDIEDPEHSPMIKLKAQAIVLGLFLLLWTSAAVGTSGTFYPVFPYQQLIANSLYCLFAFCLGAFVLFFFCVARSDVRARWGDWCRILGTQRRCCRTRSVSDTHAGVPLQPAAVTMALVNRPPSVNSALTGRSSNSNRTKAVLELNNCDSSDVTVMHCKPSNTVNLVAMHRQIYRSNNSMPTYQEISNQNCAEAFYNPRQSIVAKKFFKKQRRHRRNDLGMRRRGDGGGTSEGEPYQPPPTWRPSAESAVFLSSDMENNSEKIPANIFGYGSKINNTNIHIGSMSRSRNSQSPKNPNVLSEEEEVKSDDKQLLSRLVIGAEIDGEDDISPGTSGVLDRVDEECQPPDCRSVQLQCSLGDSSDIPEGDDSFCQKIDSLQLTPHSDESSADRLASPPQFVTVLDPKYGVVKVTMHDYAQQRLVSSPGNSESHLPCNSLPCTPEDVVSEEQPSECEDNPEGCDTCDGGDEVSSRERLLKASSSSPVEDDSSDNDAGRNLKLDLRLNNYLPRKRRYPPRRSEPSSPENKFVRNSKSADPQRSLPSSPSYHRSQVNNILVDRRPSPRLTLPPPPPPDLPLTTSEEDSAAGVSSDSLAEQDQWQKPEPPISPPDHRSPNRRPISEDLVQRHDLLLTKRLSLTLSPDISEENKKETSV